MAVYSEEAIFSSQEEAATRIILHSLTANISLPDTSCIVVRSPDTDALVLLAKYCKDIKRTIYFYTGMGIKQRLMKVNDIVKNKVEVIFSILPAI